MQASGPNKVWNNDGAGNFTDSGQSLGSSSSLRLYELADLDGDGDVDAFVGNNGADKVWLNDGSGVFSDSGQSLESVLARSAVLGDVDGDGDVDALASGNGKLWLNDGLAGFTDSGQTIGPGGVRSVGFIDLDGDGDLDAFLADCCNNGNEVWLNQPVSPAITNTAPANGEIDVGVAANVTILFDSDINPASISTNTFTVRGQQFGIYPGIFSFPMSNEVVFNPSIDFLYGESIEVTVGSSVLSTCGAGLGTNQSVIQFEVEVTACATFTFTDSGQALGPFDSRKVEFGDVDGDGDLDIVEATQNGQANKVFSNDSTGTFTDSGEALGSFDTHGLSLGDLNGDGSIDVFSVVRSAGNRVYTNDGAGSFTDTAQSLGTFQSFDVRVGDVDGDGDLDAVVANTIAAPGTPNRIYVNDGLGSFSDSGQMLGTNNSEGVDLGDIDGDGDLDAVFCNYTVAGSDPANRIHFNNGPGVFTISGQTLGSVDTRSAALGDVDGDGDLDVVFGNRAVGNSIYANDGFGVFTDTAQSLGSSRSFYVKLGDLDGDSDLDVVFANENNEANRVYTNAGAGVFSSFQTLGNGDSTGVALGDVDADGDLDVTFANEGAQANPVWINGGLPITITSTAPANGDTDVAINTKITVTFDQDIDTGSISSNTITIRGQQFGMYPGTFSFPMVNVVEFNPSVDFLHGESIEVTVGSNVLSTCGVSLGASYEVFEFETETPGCTLFIFTDSGQALGSDTTYGVSLGDVDGDADLDLIFGSQPQPTRVYSNDGAGVFTDSGQTLGANASRSVPIGDIDGDGDLDIIEINANGNATRIYTNNGAGIYTDSGQSLNGPSHRIGGDLGDVDGDGDLDLVVTTTGGSSPLYFNDGLGVYSDSGQSLGSAAEDVDFGDVDGDGDLDAVYAVPSAANNPVHTNDGSGLFTASGQNLGSGTTRGVILADVDGDNDLDALLANTSGTAGDQVFKNNGSGVFTDTGQTLGGTASSRDVDVGDLDWRWRSRCNFLQE